jgi:hypothetical protein
MQEIYYTAEKFGLHKNAQSNCLEDARTKLATEGRRGLNCSRPAKLE